MLLQRRRTAPQVASDRGCVFMDQRVNSKVQQLMMKSSLIDLDTEMPVAVSNHTRSRIIAQIF